MSTITDGVLKDIKDSTDTTNVLCSTEGTSWSNAPDSVDMFLRNTLLGETELPDTLVGFALDGVPIVQNLTKDTNRDILYPLGGSRPKEKTLDI